MGFLDSLKRKCSYCGRHDVEDLVVLVRKPSWGPPHHVCFKCIVEHGSKE